MNLPVTVDEMTLAAGFFSDLRKLCLASPLVLCVNGRASHGQ